LTTSRAAFVRRFTTASPRSITLALSGREAGPRPSVVPPRGWDRRPQNRLPTPWVGQVPARDDCGRRIAEARAWRSFPTAAGRLSVPADYRRLDFDGLSSVEFSRNPSGTM
jgi:hypothetical protein